jgi:hypothetical protein
MLIPRTLSKDIHFLGVPMSQFVGLGVVHGALFCMGFLFSLVTGIKMAVFIPFMSFIGWLIFLKKIQKGKPSNYLINYVAFHILTKGHWRAR